MARKLLRLAALVLALGAAPAASAAPAPAGDSVTGVATNGDGRDFTRFTFDAHSGASGENPTGTVVFDTLFGSFGALPVSCLTVSLKRASMVIDAPPNAGIAGFYLTVEDNGPGPQEGLDWSILNSLPPDCPIPSGAISQSETGDIVVTDSPPAPTTYAQCRQAGWVKYGFAGHADCNAYVHERARQACIFERVAHGVTAFRLKYGLDPDHTFAMRHCVRLQTGW